MSNSLFHLNDNVDIDSLLNDFQHDVTATIERYKDEPEFPHIHDFNITAGELDDYLFEKQVILDSNGTERSRYTLAGTLVVLPVVILAFFPVDDLPFKEYSVFPAMLIGLLLYGLVYATRKALIRKRLGRLDNDYVNVKRYVDAVMDYKQSRV